MPVTSARISLPRHDHTSDQARNSPEGWAKNRTADEDVKRVAEYVEPIKLLRFDSLFVGSGRLDPSLV